MRRFAIVSMLIGSAFGALWLSWAIEAFGGANAPAWPAYAFALATFAVAVGRLEGRQSFSGGSRWNGTRSLLYLAIVIGEILALNILVYELESHGLLAYLRPAIGLIIGLHFLPLARTFDIPAMKLLGTVMIVGAIAAIAAISIGLPVAIVVGTDALINGLSLLAITILPRRRVV